MPVRKNLKYKEATQIVREGLNAGLTAAALVLQSQMIRSFGTQGGRVIGRTESGRNIYAAAPAGAYPGVRTGRLRQSIYAKPSQNLRAAVGTNVRHGRWLETGTRRMLARPWAARSLALARQRMSQTLRAKSTEYIRARAALLGGAATR